MKLKETLLNEGPGAGYSISGFISNPSVKSFKVTNEDKLDLDNPDNLEIEISCDIAATFDNVEFASYYYGGKLESTPINISNFVLFMDNLPEYNNLDDVTKEGIEKSLDGLYVRVMIGGGWAHTTFDGHIETTELTENSVYLGEILGIEFDLLKDRDIVYIDRKVSGDLEDEEDYY